MTEATPGGASRPAQPRLAYPPSYAEELKHRVLDELAMVQGRIKVAETLDPNMAKEEFRKAHGSQRGVRLQSARKWLLGREDDLMQNFANGDEIDPARIDPVVIPVRTPQDVDVFKYATLQWSVPVSNGYGRRTRFLVRDRQNGKLIAIFALGDPVIAQSARDTAIGWNTEQRNNRLYNVYDAFVLGAVEPYRQLLGGKLAALLTISNETRDFLFHKYEGQETGIRKQIKDPTPVLITTSSALGRSSVYNRITFEGALMFRSVGFTKGYGHFQFSDELFVELRDYVRDVVLDDPNAKIGSTVYGSGPNWRFRIIRTALTQLEIPAENLQHNIKREVFLAPTAVGWDAYLRGETNEIEPFDLPTERIGEYYRNRWAIGRAERRPGFALWNREEARLLPKASLGLTSTVAPTPGRVDMGAYSLAIGTAARVVHGRTPAGAVSDGVAYISRLEGPGLAISAADIAWANGEREVRGWDRHDSDPVLEDVIGRLRIGVHPAERFKTQSVMELRTAVRKAGAQSNVAKTTSVELSESVGFDVAATFDKLAEAMVGTRESLLKDTGTRRGQLCVVFDDSDRVTPVLAWAITRPLSLLLTDGREKPTAPVLQRKPPRMEDMNVDRSATGPA